MNLYLISGLATDARVFKYIKVPEGFNLFYLDLINPKKDEHLPSYAIRLAEKINSEEPFILIGFSFGGMLAIEIAKKLRAAAIVLISSISSSGQLPMYYRVGAAFALHKFIPISWVKTCTRIKRSYEYRNSSDKNTLVQLAEETDPSLLRWSFEAILNWENEKTPWNTWHIHGSRDEILPVKFTRPTHIIRNAKHLLIMERPQEINHILNEILSPYLQFNTPLCPSS